jgi:pSer/pThr/pTyr-binding forkhead associated (FHA) protein/DNA-binding CsgD family transcriptional regulator
LLEIWLGDQRWQFDDGPVVIGRADDSDVRVDDDRVSRRHLEARREAGLWRVRDLESSNGTFLEQRRVTEVEVAGVVELSLADAAEGLRLRFGSTGGAEPVTVIPAGRDGRVVRIGRALDNDLVLDDTRVSRYHAELIVQRDGQSEIRDCGSANGIIVNGRKAERAPVDADTVLEIGDATLRLVQSDKGPALELVARGVTQQVSEARTGGPATKVETVASPDVTVRERELLALLAGGATDRQIADELFISIATVRSHLDRIQEKTGRRRRADLTRLALEIGVEPRSPASG